MPTDLVHAELIAVLTAISGDEPRVMTVDSGTGLPSGPFESSHRSLQHGLRAWVQEQTGSPPGYLEQLYTFADRDRAEEPDHRTVSIGYLGLMRERELLSGRGASWRGWYHYFPWEDHRAGRPEVLGAIESALAAWAEDTPAAFVDDRKRRIAASFGSGPADWDDELVLQRYELLYEAGLVGEARAPGGVAFGQAMTGDHRRILATAIARLRAKIKYRPVVFELMPQAFTLLQLQRAMEAIAGLKLYKPNFRRLIEQSDLVEETGESLSETGGRPAKLFRFRQSVIEGRGLSGARLPIARN